jgi:hypothetical protein
MFFFEVLLFCSILFFNVKFSKTKIEASKANTPPSLFGIARKIA